MELTPAYTLFAIPTLIASGPRRGKLGGITFIAQSPHRTVRWFVKNSGQLDRIFTEFSEFEAGQRLIHALRSGSSVSLPGEFTLEPFAAGFHPVPCRSKQAVSHRQRRSL